jgi:Uma2 family endonuclease
MTAAELTRPKIKARRVWTYDEMVAELPETNQPVELWNGEIITSPAPHPNHQRIVRGFNRRLDRFVEENELGEVLFSPVDVVLTQRRVVQPDVLFISKARLDIIKNYIDGVPDLAMEVISEGSWQRDRIEKKALYEQSGLPEYWIVDPDSETIEVFALIKGVYQLHRRAVGAQTAKSKLLPGFGLSFKDLLSK